MCAPHVYLCVCVCRRGGAGGGGFEVFPLSGRARALDGERAGTNRETRVPLRTGKKKPHWRGASRVVTPPRCVTVLIPSISVSHPPTLRTPRAVNLSARRRGGERSPR